MTNKELVTTEEKLDMLHKMRQEHLNIITLFRVEMIELSRPIQDKIDDINRRMDLARHDISADIDMLEGEIKADTIETGETRRGRVLQCVPVKGKRTVKLNNVINLATSNPAFSSPLMSLIDTGKLSARIKEI